MKRKQASRNDKNKKKRKQTNKKKQEIGQESKNKNT